MITQTLGPMLAVEGVTDFAFDALIDEGRAPFEAARDDAIAAEGHTVRGVFRFKYPGLSSAGKARPRAGSR